MYFFRVPLVLDDDSKELVFIEDVRTGSTRNLICYNCGKPMIAVNRDGNIPKPYFRHKNLECKATLESYIHWLSKEVFKELQSIKLPSIDFEFLYKYYWINDESFDLIISELFNKYKIPEKLRDLSNFNVVVQNEKELFFDNYKSEVSSQSKYGYIRTDIVIFSENEKYFIEPYYTHEIEDSTFKRIVNIDISTMVINLKQFLIKTNFIYSKEQFKNFIKNDVIEKYWFYINSEERNKLLLIFKEKIENYIKESIFKIDDYNEIIKKKSLIAQEKAPFINLKKKLREEHFLILDKINALRDQIIIVDDKISKIDNELKSIDNTLDEEQKKLNSFEYDFFMNY